MKQAPKESLEKSAGCYGQMKSVTQTTASKHKCSLQEAVYQVMPERWLRNFFRGVLYAIYSYIYSNMQQ